MCESIYTFEDGLAVECEIIEPVSHTEHRGYFWNYTGKAQNLAIGKVIRWQDKDKNAILPTSTLQYTQSEAVVLRHALGSFIKSDYDSEADRIRGAVAQQLIRKLQGV